MASTAQFGAKDWRKSVYGGDQVLCKLSKPKPLNSISLSQLGDIPFAFSFPLCDLLICEFPTTQSAVGLSTSLVPESQRSVAEKVSRVAQYIYQKVVRRKPVPYQPSPKEPKYLLCYVEEELECGHKIEVYPGESETLTARTRNCHECSGWFGGLKLPEGKKPNASILRSYERVQNKKQAGKSWWELVFAAGCLLFMVGLVWFNRPHPLIFSPENNHTVIRVLRQYNDFDWQIQRVVDSVPQTPEVRHFDEKPLFEPGMTLSWLEVNDRGKFWSVKHVDPWFRLERDYLGWPTLAPNCRQDLEHDHVVCDGVPRW